MCVCVQSGIPVTLPHTHTHMHMKSFRCLLCISALSTLLLNESHTVADTDGRKHTVKNLIVMFLLRMAGSR